MSKRIQLIYKFTALSGLLCSGPLQAATLTVSHDGPVATLEGARLRVRELKKQHPGEPIEVLIKGGVYPLRETVVFGLEDSGSEGAPITYKAFPGEHPVFTGGIPVGGWKKVTDYPEGTAESAKGNLWSAPIPKGGGREWYIRSLYDGEELLKRAKSDGFYYAEIEKENDFNRQGKKLTSMLEYEGEPVAPFDRDVYFRDDNIRDWKNPYDIELKLKDRPWLANLIPLERIDMEKKIARLAADPTYQPIRTTNRYWVMNAIDYLDEPGEWVVNTQEGRIYMWPEEDPSGMNVIAPFLQEFIRVEGKEDGPFAEHLHFEGLTFVHGARDTMLEGDKGLQHDWEMYDKGNAVMRFRFAESCSFKSNVIKSSSGTGVRLDLHCQEIEVSGNHLKYLGAGGIVLSGYGPGTKDVNKNNVVHDNYIHHIGELLWHSCAIFVAQSGHNEITHNTIHDLPYNGIVVSGCRPHEFYLVKRIPFRRAWVSTIRFEECEPYIQKGLAAQYHSRLEHFLPLLHARENHIAMNDISRVLLKLHDGNAIYFSAMGVDNVVDHNFLHENYGTAGTIRLDDNPSFTIIKNNVIKEAERGFGLKGPADLFNNFVFTETFLRGRSKPGWLGGTKQVLPVGNIFMPPASSKSSNGLYLTDDRATERPFYENLPKMENSVYFSLNQGAGYVPKAALGSDLFTGETAVDGAVKLIYADPLFDEDAVMQGVYRFREGSPAEALGIQPIDLRGVGSSLTRPEFGALEKTTDAEAEPVLFTFQNKSAFDDKPAGTSMSVGGVTMTTLEVIDADGVTNGGRTNIHGGQHAVGIRSASGQGDHNNFDAGEAWVFSFDRDITAIELDLAGMDKSDADKFKLSVRDGAEDFSVEISHSVMENGLFTLNRSIGAQIPIEMKLTAGEIARIEAIRITPSNR